MVRVISSVSLVVVLVFNRTVNGKYTGAEIRSKQGYPTAKGRCTKVEWRARPAVGNCVITLFSLFNGDLALNPEIQHPPTWSEIGIEVFGGSANNNSQFQTQFISQASLESATKHHMVPHIVGENANVTDIFDHSFFHTFAIEFCPDDDVDDPTATTTNCTAQATYWLDEKVIRRETGGDLCALTPPFDIYAANWVTSPRSIWGCTSNEKRPQFAEAVIDHIRVYENDTVVQNYVFFNENDMIAHWDKSNWGFPTFDGVYDPNNIDVFLGNAFLKLIRDRKVTN